jgi:hypothetical protein
VKLRARRKVEDVVRSSPSHPRLLVTRGKRWKKGIYALALTYIEDFIEVMCTRPSKRATNESEMRAA